MRLIETIKIPAYSRLSEELGDGLNVIDAKINSNEAAIIQEHVSGLLAVPAGILSRLRVYGLTRVLIGKGGVASFPGYEGYRGVRIPNASLGETWDVSRGAYIPSRREIVLGTGPFGYEGTALHEIGHALGDLLSFDTSTILAREYKAKASGILGSYREYYPNGRPTDHGKKEFFAETVMLGIMDQRWLNENFSRPYCQFIIKDVLRP